MSRDSIAHRAEFPVRCACGIVYNTDDSHIGKQIKCRCGRIVTIVRPADDYRAPADDHARESSHRAAHTSRRRHSNTRSSAPLSAMPQRAVGATRQWLRDSWHDARSRRALKRWTTRLAWGWGVFVVLTWLLLITTSEKFLPATLLAYGPRFVMLAPFLVLVPMAAVAARRALVPLTLALLVVTVPIMGWRLSWRSAFSSPATSPPPGAMRLISYNTGGGGKVALNLRGALEDLRPDVVTLQECGSALWDSVQAMTAWYSARASGTCTLSRWKITSVDTMPRGDFAAISALGYGGAGNAVRHLLDTPYGPMVVVNVHLETARKGLYAFLGQNPALLKTLGIKPMSSRRVLNAKGTADDRAEINAEIRNIESQRAAAWAQQGNRPVPVIVAGDFNLPVESAIFRRHWGKFTDAFEASGTGYGFTKHEGDLLRIRIDHILGNDYAPKPIGTWLGTDLGSDHKPVIADLAWQR